MKKALFTIAAIAYGVDTVLIAFGHTPAQISLNAAYTLATLTCVQFARGEWL